MVRQLDKDDDDMISVRTPEGEPLVCDKCNLPISDERHHAIEVIIK